MNKTLIIFISILTFSFSGKDKQKNEPDVQVYFLPITHDSKEIGRRLKDERFQRSLIRDVESKMQLDKMAFQEILATQNEEIEKLGELVKAGGYLVKKKRNSNEKTLFQMDAQGRKDQVFSKKIAEITDPFDVYVNDELTAELKQRAKQDEFAIYSSAVDSIYGS